MVAWDTAADRKLLLLALKQLSGSLDYKRLRTEFGEDVTENTLRIRICNLRKAEGLGSPFKVKSGRVTKSSPGKTKAVKSFKEEDTPSPDHWPEYEPGTPTPEMKSGIAHHE